MEETAPYFSKETPIPEDHFPIRERQSVTTEKEVQKHDSLPKSAGSSFMTDIVTANAPHTLKRVAFS